VILLVSLFQTIVAKNEEYSGVLDSLSGFGGYMGGKGTRSKREDCFLYWSLESGCGRLVVSRLSDRWSMASRDMR
jgi:hypothetical protein